MKDDLMLTVMSLLSVILLTFHLAHDIVYRFEKGDVSNLIAVPIFVLWLYATLVLAGRRSGYIIILLLSLLAMGVPVIHMMGRGIGGGRVAGSSGAFFFAWTLIAIGVTSLFSAILSLRGLWSLPWRRARAS